MHGGGKGAAKPSGPASKGAAKSEGNKKKNADRLTEKPEKIERFKDDYIEGSHVLDEEYMKDLDELDDYDTREQQDRYDHDDPDYYDDYDEPRRQYHSSRPRKTEVKKEKVEEVLPAYPARRDLERLENCQPFSRPGTA